MANKPRRWIKVYCYETLHGSVSYQLNEAEHDVWIKLLCYAGLCGHEGIIADHDLRPYPHSHVIREINTTQAVFESTLTKCIDEGRIIETNGHGIQITNWSKYQSEYDRQKQYRDKDPHLYVGPGRAKQIKKSVDQVNTEEHMAKWEAAHPGRKHPGRAG